MGAIAVVVTAIGSALLLYVAITATVLCRKALQDGGEFEAEIKAPSLAFRMRASRMPTNGDGTDSQHGSTRP